MDVLGGGKIGFADVGSGGKLKAPWALLPPERLSSFSFEPTDAPAGSLPRCVSDKTGTSPFYVAHDERASSLHKPLADFVKRYAFENMLTKKTLTVDCVSLDEHFKGRYESVDAMDVNVEGHDFQVLQGAEKLLATGAVKLLKVEFELVPVYAGQGFFADIDAYLRAHGYALATIQVDDLLPTRTRHLHHKGESVWGKALYVPATARREARLDSILASGGREAARKELAATVALYASAQVLGHLDDAVVHAEKISVISDAEARTLQDGLSRAFRWARVESGADKVGELTSSILRTFNRKK
jgi:FkbM family methyltransferase